MVSGKKDKESSYLCPQNWRVKRVEGSIVHVDGGMHATPLFMPFCLLEN